LAIFAPNLAPKARPALYNPQPLGPHAAQLKVLAAVNVSDMLTTSSYFDNLQFEIFDAGSPQCHFIMSDAIVVRIRSTLPYSKFCSLQSK